MLCTCVDCEQKCVYVVGSNQIILFIVRNLQKTSLALRPGAKRLTTTSNTYSARIESGRNDTLFSRREGMTQNDGSI